MVPNKIRWSQNCPVNFRQTYFFIFKRCLRLVNFLQLPAQRLFALNH